MATPNNIFSQQLGFNLPQFTNPDLASYFNFGMLNQQQPQLNSMMPQMSLSPAYMPGQPQFMMPRVAPSMLSSSTGKLGAMAGQSITQQLQGIGTGTPALAPTAATAAAKVTDGSDYLDVPREQWTGKHYEAFFNKNRPSSVLPTINAVTEGVGTLGNLVLGGMTLYDARKAFNFQKQMTLDNFNNTVDTYNQSMEDKIRARYGTDADKAYVDAQVDKRRLKNV